MKSEDWEQTLEVNLSAVFRLSKACLRRMLKERHGRIINIGSVVGAIGNAGPGALRGGQGRPGGLHQGAGARGGYAQHHRQHRGARIHRDRYDARA